MRNPSGDFKPNGTTKTTDAIDIAARYFVYKLYEETDGQPNQWLEREWVILQPDSGTRKAALTDEGRRLARKGS